MVFPSDSIVASITARVAGGTLVPLDRPYAMYYFAYLVFLAAAVVSQLIGYFSIGYALGHVPASLVAPTMVAQPVLTMFLAIPLTGELPLPGQWLGALAVVAGIYLVNRRPSVVA